MSIKCKTKYILCSPVYPESDIYNTPDFAVIFCTPCTFSGMPMNQRQLADQSPHATPPRATVTQKKKMLQPRKIMVNRRYIAAFNCLSRVCTYQV